MRRITMLKLQDKITKSTFWFHISLLLNASLMNRSVPMAREILSSSYIQLNNWIDSTINLTIAELWIHHVLSFRIKARTPMQGSQKEEERNLQSHNRITLSEVISLNLTICRSREKKKLAKKRETELKGREMRWEHLQRARERKKKKRRDIQWDE